MIIEKYNSKQTSIFVCLTLILLHIIWIYMVEPYPEKDSIFPFYFPFLNYLYASIFIGNDYFFLLENLNSSNYPIGVYFFAYLISSLSLQSIFLKFPYLLSIFIIITICLVPFFSKHKYKYLIPLILYFNPLVTLCIRSFSPHSFIVLFGIISFLSFRSCIYKVKPSKVIIFMLSSVLAISIKHLGLLYFICLGFSFATWSIIRKHLNYQLIAAYLCSLVIGLSFYPINNSLIYLKNAIAHNNSINTNQFLFITAIIVIFFTCVFYVTNYKTSDKVVLPKLFSYFILPILLSTIICFFVVQPRYSPSNLCIAIILINSLIISAFSYFFTLSKLRGFTYIFIAISLVVASLLYFSHIGKSFYIFAIPLILCFHQSFCESKNIKAFIFIILGEIIFSNFFPSLQYLNKKSSYLGDQVYTSLFNTTYINYLSWQSCKIPKIRKEIEHTISAYDFPIHQNKIIFINLHQHTQVSLYLPYNLQAPHPTFAKLEDSLASDLSALKNQTIDNPIQIFSQMQTSHEFPLIIEALKPFTQSDHRVSDSLVEVLINNEKSLNEFAQVFALEYFQRIKTSHQLNKLYHQYKVPKIDPSFNIYIKKSIPLKNENKVVNFELNELIDTYQGSKK